jgi:ABC-2 type transport system permease protein
MSDALTVAWKEIREILARGGAFRRGRTLTRTLLFPIGIGLLFGFQSGRATDSSGRSLGVFFVGMFAMTTAGALVIDAIAGERERHTLETLLASPASDRALLAGKVGAVVGYAWAIALVQLAAVEIGAVLGGRAIPAWVIVVVAVLSALEATLAAAFGVQFSLRAPTVRAAVRKQGLYSLVVTIVAAGVNGVVAAPASAVVHVVAVAVGVTVLLAADAVLLAIAQARFRRGRLLLD